MTSRAEPRPAAPASRIAPGTLWQTPPAVVAQKTAPQTSAPDPAAGSPVQPAAGSTAEGRLLPLVPAGHPDPLRAAPVVLLTSEGCHACQAAKPLIAETAAEFGVQALEMPLDRHPDLLAEHGPQIPVLVIDGVPRDFWVIDPARFRRLLEAREAADPSFSG